MSDHRELRPPSCWLPEPRLLVHQAVGKMGEEAGELAKISCRVLIQGVDGDDPSGGEANLTALLDEMADVEALVILARRVLYQEGLGVDSARYADRMSRKLGHKEAWMDMLRSHSAAGKERHAYDPDSCPLDQLLDDFQHAQARLSAGEAQWRDKAEDLRAAIHRRVK